MANEVKTVLPKTNEGLGALIDRMETTMQQVRNRAYSIFERRNYLDGFDLDDWFRAERELFQIPEAEMAEANGELRIRVAAPGFGAENLEVTVLPRLIMVEGKMEKEDKGEQKQVHFCEFHAQQLMRRFPLPEPIDPGTVKAVLTDGMLTITAQKAKGDVQGKKVEVKEVEVEKELAAAAAV